MFRQLKVRTVAFKNFESIAGRYRMTEEFEKDILMPTHPDQTIEEFLNLTIQRRQRELDCEAAGKWVPVAQLER